MKYLRIALVVSVLWMYLVVSAQTDGTSLDERGYGLFIPSSYDADSTEERPLLIALHGFGDNWRNFYAVTGFSSLAERENILVAFPQGYLYQWNDGSLGDHTEDEIQLFRDLIVRVNRDYRVDLDRVYLVGFSNGGTMVYKAACEAPDLFAGVVAVGGTMRRPQSRNCDDTQLPVAMIHGTADQVVPFEGGEYRYAVPEAAEFWAAQNGCNLDSTPPYDEDQLANGYVTQFYTQCPDGNYVLLHALRGVNHTWPGVPSYIRNQTPQQPYIDTAEIIWQFFEIAHQYQFAPGEGEIQPETTQVTGD